MKIKYLQVIGAFLIGLTVPVLAMQIGAMAFTRTQATVPPQETVPSQETQPSIQQTVAQPQPGSDKEEKIHVLLLSGQTIEMDLEEYLIGVLLAEMSTSYEMDALRAQAVVARTYALKRQQEKRHPMDAVCADYACCQAYISTAEYLDGLGYPPDVEKASVAVRDTKGEVLTYRGKLILATYFSSSGGRTEDAVAVWGVVYPYLQAVESPGEENLADYKKEEYFTKEQLEQSLGRTLTGKPENWVGWTTYTTGGGVRTINFADQEYSGTQLRSLLKLNSTAFAIYPWGNGIVITTLGRGHRVGMSQTGAQAMALAGCSYGEILSHYYSGAGIDKIENMQ